MAAIGVLSDSHGDLGAFDAAYELLRAKGARRFFFNGGRYSDLDEWLSSRREKARGGRAYSDLDFLADVSNFLGSKDQLARPAAFGASGETQVDDELNSVGDRFLRTPERECLQYRDPAIGHKSVDMIGDVLCCVVHDKNDLTREDLLNAVIFVHGKEPEPKVVQIGPRFFVTPGKLTGAADQTCGLIETVDRSVSFSAFTLEGKTLIDRKPLNVASKTKLSVR